MFSALTLISRSLSVSPVWDSHKMLNFTVVVQSPYYVESISHRLHNSGIGCMYVCILYTYVCVYFDMTTFSLIRNPAPGWKV